MISGANTLQREIFRRSDRLYQFHRQNGGCQKQRKNYINVAIRITDGNSAKMKRRSRSEGKAARSRRSRSLQKKPRRVSKSGEEPVAANGGKAEELRNETPERI